MPPHANPAIAPTYTALATLAILQLIMLGALYAGVPPHPPARLPLFAMAPFLGLSLALCAVAAILLKPNPRSAATVALAASLAAMVSYGPHKIVDPAFAQIWPAVLGAQAAVIALLFQLPKLRNAK